MLAILEILRQNHAVEHATMHLLSQRNPYVRLVGRSTPAGFVIYGNVSTETVADSAADAVARLQQGEAHLAVHPRCGTNLAVTGLLAGSAAFGATLGHPRSKLERLPVALAAATLAVILAQPLAHTVQERITTSPQVDGLYIASVTRQERGSLIAHRVTVGRA
jgi:hypothetical protein